MLNLVTNSNKLISANATNKNYSNLFIMKEKIFRGISRIKLPKKQAELSKSTLQIRPAHFIN